MTKTQQPEGRIVVVTGSASGIGAATAERLRDNGITVLGVDLHGADVTADLSQASGRAHMIREIRSRVPEGIDGIVANAGVFQDSPLALRLNYFGAVATLEGLRPLLRPSAPRAVLVSSRVIIQPVVLSVVDKCLADDEPGAIRLAEALPDSAKATLYATSKRAAARWLRRTAPSEAWASAGIALNAVAPGTVDTPMVSADRDDPAFQRMMHERPMPLGGLATPEEIASVIWWLLEPANSKMTGQVIFVDGGGEALMRSEDLWEGTLR